MYNHKLPSRAAKRGLNQPPLLGGDRWPEIICRLHTIMIPTHIKHSLAVKLKSDYIFLESTRKMVHSIILNFISLVYYIIAGS